MARAATSMLLLGLLLVAPTEASVAVIKAPPVPVDVTTQGTHVTVKTGASPVCVDVTGSKEQKVQVSTGQGKAPISVDVKDGDTIAIVPDCLGGGYVNINVNGVFKGHI